jgi:hypothetical protein
MLQRQALLDRAHRERWTLVLDHEPDHPAFTVERDADSPGGFKLNHASL